MAPIGPNQDEEFGQALYALRWRSRRREQENPGPAENPGQMLWLNVVAMAMQDAWGESPGDTLGTRDPVERLACQAQGLVWCCGVEAEADRQEICDLAGVDHFALREKVLQMARRGGVLDAEAEQILQMAEDSVIHLAADFVVRRRIGLLPPSTKQERRMEERALANPAWASALLVAEQRRAASAQMNSDGRQHG